MFESLVAPAQHPLIRNIVESKRIKIMTIWMTGKAQPIKMQPLETDGYFLRGTVDRLDMSVAISTIEMFETKWAV